MTPPTLTVTFDLADAAQRRRVVDAATRQGLTVEWLTATEFRVHADDVLQFYRLGLTLGARNPRAAAALADELLPPTNRRRR